MFLCFVHKKRKRVILRSQRLFTSFSTSSGRRESRLFLEAKEECEFPTDINQISKRLTYILFLWTNLLFDTILAAKFYSSSHRINQPLFAIMHTINWLCLITYSSNQSRQNWRSQSTNKSFLIHLLIDSTGPPLQRQIAWAYRYVQICIIVKLWKRRPDG